MKTKICLNTWKRLTKLTAICALVLISSAFAGSMVVVQKLKHGSAAGTGQPNACSQTSQHALDSCRAGPQSEYTLTLASCDNIPNSAARQQCRDQTLTTLHEAQQTCQAQLAARKQLCRVLGGEPYNPVIHPANFGDQIDNAFFPLEPGRTLIYKAHTPDGLKRNDVTTTHDTVEISRRNLRPGE